jgi:cytochrome c peroxidase
MIMKTNVLCFLGGMLLFFLSGCEKDAGEKPHHDWVYAPTAYNLNIPATFPILEIPASNPTTVQGVKLGRMLYYDPILDRDSTRACADCHIQSNSFTSAGEVLPHLNLAWNTAFLWNGKVQGTLEDIMLFEVKLFFQTDLRRLQNHPEYPRLFYEAYGKDTITYELAARAISQFERTLFSSKSKYDKVLDQNSGVFLTDEELSGYEIFFTEKGDCFHCHGGILFTDNQFHNNALDANPEAAFSETTGFALDRGRFKTPTLRNIELTGPYMHDGRYTTLEEVIDFYSEGLKSSETVDPLMKNLHVGGIRLTTQEKHDLLAFLKTLTDTAYTTNPLLSSPF